MYNCNLIVKQCKGDCERKVFEYIEKFQWFPKKEKTNKNN